MLIASWRNTRITQGGFGLPELLVASAIATVLMLALSSAVKNFSNSARKTVSLSETGNMGGRLVESVHCQSTFGPIGGTPGDPCTHGSFLNLRSETGAILVSADSANPTRIGEWTVRARCKRTNTGGAWPGRGIEIRAAKLSAGASVIDFPVPASL
jgi:prepilin-type N-terminal cleavage/methylation domain-containing protein